MRNHVPRILMRGFYHWRYFTGKTPWDTNITPPEVVQLIETENLPPGRALDLGCGTGTNAIYLAQRGFQVIGIDYVSSAITAAARKASAHNVRVEFRAADVLKPGAFAAPFDLILDIGCFHSLDPDGRNQYAANIRDWTKSGSVYLVYAFFPFHALGRDMGIARSEMEDLYSQSFLLKNYADDGKSAWYRWIKK